MTEMTPGAADRDARRAIGERLTRGGWQRDPAAEQLDWPEFGFHNGRAGLEFLYFPPEDWIRLGLVTDREEGYLQIHCGTDLDHFLDILVNNQHGLDADTWQPFIDDLLRLHFRVYAVTGEGEDDLVELTRAE